MATGGSQNGKDRESKEKSQALLTPHVERFVHRGHQIIPLPKNAGWLLVAAE
jgi:hypothetical protein